MPNNQPLKLIWDLEFCASQTFRGDLRAAPGYIFCFGYKELGKGSAKVITIKDFPGKTAIDDSYLIKEVAKILKPVDLHIYHYGNSCDWKFVQTRLMRWGNLPLNKSAAFDTCTVAKNRLSIKSNSLKSLAYFFELDEGKMEIPHDVWLLANAGDAAAIRKISERCRSDVRLTEQVYNKLMPLVENHPAIYKMKKLEDGKYTERPRQCQSCCSTRIKSNGFTATAKTIKQRYRCTSCNASMFVAVPVKYHKES